MLNEFVYQPRLSTEMMAEETQVEAWLTPLIAALNAKQSVKVSTASSYP